MKSRRLARKLENKRVANQTRENFLDASIAMNDMEKSLWEVRSHYEFFSLGGCCQQPEILNRIGHNINI
jgi:hypothetical protein